VIHEKPPFNGEGEDQHHATLKPKYEIRAGPCQVEWTWRDSQSVGILGVFAVDSSPETPKGISMRKTFRIKHRTIISLALALTLSTTAAAQTPAVTTSQTASDPALQRLEREIARLSTASGGVVGVTAIHLETGRRVSMNGTERFPMASTFKVPIAVQLLTRIDKGGVRLDQMIDIKQSDLHPGSGTIADLFNKGGLALSVRNLMELMLLISDNSATDVMLRTAVGAEAVTARMRSLGIEGINLNRSTAQLIADWVGVTSLPPEDRWNPAVFFVAFNNRLRLALFCAFGAWAVVSTRATAEWVSASSPAFLHRA
jgi:hypothetical protein